MARKRTGEKQWRVRLKTFVGRVRGEDGQRSAWTDLDTDDPHVAEQRLEQWLLTGEPPAKNGRELFRDAAERIVNRQEARGEKGASNRRHRLRAFALPVIGHLEVGAIEAHNVHSVLGRMEEQRALVVRGAKAALARGETLEAFSGKVGLTTTAIERWLGEADDPRHYSVDTVHHLRVDISRILAELKREGAVAVNVARDVDLPEDVELDERPRVVLTDEEILRFRRRGFDTELDMMSLCSRELGGMRTSDLHAFDWSDIDTRDWQTAVVRRPKTEGASMRKRKRKGRRRTGRAFERVKHVLPESMIAPLQAWWVKQGSPVTGPVFPLRRGKKAGQRKTGKGISYVKALRKALWDEGIVRPLPGFEEAIGDARMKKCALQVDTEDSRAVDFHSFRRAYVTALAQSGVNAQTAMALSGHTDMATHQRYIMTEALAVPTAALPAPAPRALPAPAEPAQPDASARADRLERMFERLLGALGANDAAASIDPNDPRDGSNGPSAAPAVRGNPEGFPRRARKDSNLRPTAPEAIEDDPRARKDSKGDSGLEDLEQRLALALTQVAGQTSPAEPSILEGLEAAARAAVAKRNWALVEAIGALIDAQEKRAAAAAPVSLAEARAKREGGK